jgi:hypothetical protein
MSPSSKASLGKGWRGHTDNNGPRHCWPEGDTSPHDTDSPGPVCWCKPFMDGAIIVHNSADGREQHEPDNVRRKLS